MKKLTLIALLSLIVLFNSILALASSDNIDIKFYSENYLFQQQQQPGGGGDGHSISRVQAAPGQNPAAIPSDNPPVLFNPDKFRNIYKEENYVPHNKLIKFNNWDEVQKYANKQGFKGYQGTHFLERIRPNTNGLRILHDFPKFGHKMYGFFLPMETLKFLDLGLEFGESVIKSFTFANDCLVIVSQYIEGINVNNTIATRAGLNILNTPVTSSGFGVGTNSSVGMSSSYTGYILEFRPYRGVTVSQKQKPSGFYPLIGKNTFLVPTAKGYLEENVAWLKKNKKVLHDKVIDFQVYTLDKTTTNAEVLTRKIINYFDKELEPLLGKSKKFNYSIYNAGEEAGKLESIGAHHAINMRLIKK